ncbi:hypothetical protein CC85DRAFT_284997 [Cutaneotrichosporon oleaginosum]|uniref:Uncharacterized protein n=1 Tax=Cutaneotrichosporon oleaginosum TaxID=879819 RepID=A0A0J0XPJ3_9TREE|nr:uncharacterized protein CC85DRAFT_284997 [Cutaneotrichosporon oleaginosum]KLT43030.1 hypothetical protein CC85DRAFT_284997 [Cutaneotrichosporon oleaginosum]TXT11768.1 hypothetical protein COLE_02178 [Cutaneotrichosporon oleaginosum]
MVYALDPLPVFVVPFPWPDPPPTHNEFIYATKPTKRFKLIETRIATSLRSVEGSFITTFKFASGKTLKREDLIQTYLRLVDVSDSANAAYECISEAIKECPRPSCQARLLRRRLHCVIEDLEPRREQLHGLLTCLASWEAVALTPTAFIYPWASPDDPRGDLDYSSFIEVTSARRDLLPTSSYMETVNEGTNLANMLKGHRTLPEHQQLMNVPPAHTPQEILENYGIIWGSYTAPKRTIYERIERVFHRP